MIFQVRLECSQESVKTFNVKFFYSYGWMALWPRVGVLRHNLAELSGAPMGYI